MSPSIWKEEHALKIMSTAARNSNSSSSQPSSSVSPVPEISKDKDPKGKLKVIVEADGSFVGEYAKKWSTRTGELVRANIPIHYTDIRRVPKNFKDDVWNSLMAEFEFNIPPALARKHAEKSWSQKLRTYKNTLRPLLNNAESANQGPKGVDPNHWSAFAKIESEPKKKEQLVQNASNRKNLEFSHCLGRRSYAQKQHLMQQQNAGKPIGRVDKWLIGHEHSDGTVLESAKSKHDEVMAAKNRRKDKSGEGCCDSFEDLDNDELAEVFGKDKKGRVRGVGSHVSKKQLIHIGVAKSKIEGFNMANEQSASLKDEILTHVDSKLEGIKGMLASIITTLSNNAGTQSLVTTPSNGNGSNSINRPTHLSQNLDNVFATMGLPHENNSMPTATDKPPVILLDKFGKELAKGYVVTDATSKVCHFKQVGMGEKKVYIEEVYEPDARLCDPPQGGHDTLAGFIEGGFVIWLECWLRYV